MAFALKCSPQITMVVYFPVECGLIPARRGLQVFALARIDFARNGQDALPDEQAVLPHRVGGQVWTPPTQFTKGAQASGTIQGLTRFANNT